MTLCIQEIVQHLHSVLAVQALWAKVEAVRQQVRHVISCDGVPVSSNFLTMSGINFQVGTTAAVLSWKISILLGHQRRDCDV